MKLPLTAAIAAFTLAGCVVETDDDDFRSEYPGLGELVVDWAISDSQDPDLCLELDASTISIVIQTTSGVWIGDYRQACREFATSILLDPGAYVADAVLLDRGGRERTTAVQIERFSVFGDDRITIPIDFPVSSFY